MADLRNMTELQKAQYNAQKSIAKAKSRQQAKATQSFGKGLLDVGMTLNSFIPVTGDIQSGLLAVNDLKNQDYTSAALNSLGLLPFVPSMAGMVKKADKVADAVRPLSKYELAQQTAQKNAVEMLGLPPNNTAMDRAKALGYNLNMPMYHGTNADIKAFDYSKTGQGFDQYGSGHYFTNIPNTANAYVKPLNIKEGGAVYPVYTKSKNPLIYDDTAISMQKDIAQKPLTKNQVKDLITSSPNLDDGLSNWGDVAYEGKNKVLNEAVNTYYDPKGFSLQTLNQINNDFYQGIPEVFAKNVESKIGKDAIKMNFDNGEVYDVILNPNNIRSRFAAFDPARINEPDLLGRATPEMLGLLAVGSGAGIGYAYKNKENK